MGYDGGKHRTPDTMRPESSSVELTEFLTRHASLLAWLHAQSGASRWGVSREEFAAALHRSAGRHCGGQCDGQCGGSFPHWALPQG